MAAKEMYDYLSAVTADYTATELSISPQRTMIEDMDWIQEQHGRDDGNFGATTYADQPVFTVSLQWDVITEAESGTIFDFFADSAKAKGFERSFYWQHPVDGHTYTVKFFTKMQRVYQGGMPGHREISQVKFRVIGRKP